MVTEDEFAKWASDMLDRTIRPEGDAQKAAYRAGWRAGRLRLDPAVTSGALATMNAWESICFIRGRGEAMAVPQATLQQVRRAESSYARFRSRMDRKSHS